jgi:hypothetical protein
LLVAADVDRRGQQQQSLLLPPAEKDRESRASSKTDSARFASSCTQTLKSSLKNEAKKTKQTSRRNILMTNESTGLRNRRDTWAIRQPADTAQCLKLEFGVSGYFDEIYIF